MLIVGLNPDDVRPVKPQRIIDPFQDSADGASLALPPLVEAGRSDPGRHVDGTSHQRSSAVGADQPKGGIQLMPLTLPDWAPLPQIVPSQSAASPGVLKHVDG